MLTIKNIKKSYKKNKHIVEVLENVTYNFKANSLYCIVGKSGAGKSTLIKLLGLLIDKDEGSININGNEINLLSERKKAKIRNKEIGFVFQDFYLNPLMKAYENVMLPMYLNNSITDKDRKEKACELLNRVGLIGRENHFPKELSGGEQQRVAIARSLANNPNIILADEPTGSLDPESAIVVLDILKSLAKDNKCVIIVSHDEMVQKYADVVLKLENKKLKEIAK